MLLHMLTLSAALLVSSLLSGLQTPATPGALKFTAPQGWEARSASSSSGSTMRVAEFVLPGRDASAGSAELVVYYFGGSGGSVDANITRWLGQMQQPDGRATRDVAARETRTIDGLKVSLLDVSGTYVAEVRPGATEKHNSPGYRMRTAVVETPRGPYYLKLVGPATTVETWSASFGEFLASLKFGE
jgi:hypothetical protein